MAESFPYARYMSYQASAVPAHTGTERRQARARRLLVPFHLYPRSHRRPHIVSQTYELRRLMSQKSLRDVDIVPENGPNCYANLTAAVNGEKQGAFRAPLCVRRRLAVCLPLLSAAAACESVSSKPACPPNTQRTGGYTVYVTGHGDKNYTNELSALPEGVESGMFDVFFRIYVEVCLWLWPRDGDGRPFSFSLPVQCLAQ